MNLSENAKKGLLIAVTGIAGAIVAYQANTYLSDPKIEVVKTIHLPPGHKSEKQRALEAQQKAEAPGAPESQERDLGGSIGN